MRTPEKKCQRYQPYPTETTEQKCK